MRQEVRTALWILGAMCLIVLLGTIGYVLIESWSVLDSLYMTVTTIFTVGFGEIHPLSTGGRVFTVMYKESRTLQLSMST